MSASASTVNSYARSSGQPRRLLLDPWIIGTVCALLLIGLVMVASASIGISEKETGAAFHYFTRQLVYVALGLVAGCVGLAVPTRVWDEYSKYLLGGAFLLLVVVLIPGIGYEVNGSRRWIRLGFMNFQVSEATRVMLLMYVASYAVRRSDELRSDFRSFMVERPVVAVGPDRVDRPHPARHPLGLVDRRVRPTTVDRMGRAADQRRRVAARLGRAAVVQHRDVRGALRRGVRGLPLPAQPHHQGGPTRATRPRGHPVAPRHVR